MKSQLISYRIFQLILAIVGTMELGIVTTHIPNISAFQDVLCDFEVSFTLVCYILNWCAFFIATVLSALVDAIAF